MWGADSILFWCAAAHRPQAWCARCSGTLVWARPAAATPAGAGGWGRWGARCAGPAAPPPPRVAVPSGGGGASPRLQRGGGSLLWLPSWGGGAGGGGGWGGQPSAPPLRRASACHLLSPACPPGVYSCRRGCRAAAGVGRGPVGRQRVSAAGGGGEGGRGGNPPALVRAPVFPGPASDRAAPFAPSWAPPVRRWPAAGRACWRLPRPWCPRSPDAVASSGGLRGRRFFGLPPSALGPEWEGGGGESGGGPLVPWRRLLTAEGGAAWLSRPRGPAIGWGVAPFPHPPLPRAGPLRRPSLGPLVPPAVVARRWPARGGHEG